MSGPRPGAAGRIRCSGESHYTLFLPLAALVCVFRRFPEYFRDGAALSLTDAIPTGLLDDSSSEYGHMVSVARYRNPAR